MSMDLQSSDLPRYATLRDYVRVLRQRRVLVALVTLAFGAAALGISLREEKAYVAESVLAFSDPDAGLNLLDRSSNPAQTLVPVTIERIRQPRILTVARELLGGSVSEDRLRAATTVRGEARNGFVVIAARASDARVAAEIANALARATDRVVRSDTRRRFSDAAHAMRVRLRELGDERRFSLTASVFRERIARLLTLAELGDPVRVVRTAAVPASPVSPRPIRNTGLGLLLGLTLGVLAAFVRDSLDRRLRTAREVQGEVGLPVLGHVPAETLGIGAFSSNGHDPAHVGLEAFRILRANVQFLDIDQPIRSILVTSALPEEGKSTVAASLAAVSAASGKRTLLVECDLRSPALAGRLGLAPAPGLSDYLAGGAEPSDVLQHVRVGLPIDSNGGSPAATNGLVSPELICICAGSPTPRPAEMLGSRRFAEFLSQVSETYDLVVIDACPVLSIGDALELVPQVDAVLLCVRATRTTREQARAAKAAIEHFPPRPVGLVVTGVRPEDDGGSLSTYPYRAGSVA